MSQNLFILIMLEKQDSNYTLDHLPPISFLMSETHSNVLYFLLKKTSVKNFFWKIVCVLNLIEFHILFFHEKSWISLSTFILHLFLLKNNVSSSNWKNKGKLNTFWLSFLSGKMTRIKNPPNTFTGFFSHFFESIKNRNFTPSLPFEFPWNLNRWPIDPHFYD